MIVQLGGPGPDIGFEADGTLDRWNGGTPAAGLAAPLIESLLGEKANVLEAPFLAQPRSADDFQDLLERRIRIGDFGRNGRVLHGPFPHHAGGFPPVIFPGMQAAKTSFAGSR